MKKTLMIIAVMALFVTVAVGQNEKGKTIVSGASDLSFTSMTMQMEYDGEDFGDEMKVKGFNIKPSVGYFIVDNLALGLTFDYESQKVDDYKESTFMFGPMIRYYLGTTNIKPYLHADVLFGNQVEDDGNDEYKTNVSGWDLGAGVAFFLNDCISIDLGLGYGSLTMTDDEDSKAKLKANGVAFTGGFSLFF